MNRAFCNLLVILLALTGCRGQTEQRMTDATWPSVARQMQKSTPAPVPTLTASWQELPLHTWTQVAFATQDVPHLAISLTGETPVLYASLVDILYRSPDGGRTWQPITPAGACAKTAAQVMAHRTRPAALFAFGSAGVYGMDCAFLVTSGDGGETWETRALPQYQFMGGTAWPTRVVMESHPETGAWYQFVQGSWMGRASGQGLAWSTDQGQSWHNMLLPPAGKATVPLYDFHGFFKAPSQWVLLVTQREGYYLSGTPGFGDLSYSLADGGWERITLPGVLYQLAMTPDGQQAYAVSGTYPPTDSCELVRLTPDLNIEQVGPLPVLSSVCGRLDVQSEQLFWVKPRLYDHDQVEAVFSSPDGGSSWQRVALPEPLGVYDLAVQPGSEGNPTILYLATDNGLWAYPYSVSLLPPQ